MKKKAETEEKMNTEEIQEAVENAEETTPTEEAKQDAKTPNLGKIEALENQLSEAKDKYIRLAADFDNFKKRAAKESETKYLDSKADALKQFLPIVDNFERAVKLSVPEDAKTYADGINMILGMFLKILKDNNVEEIDALNQTFDPEKHFAVMHVDDENFGPNTVCEVFEKGYKMGDRILRYSMVKVAN